VTLLHAAAMTTLVIGTLGLAVAGVPAAIVAWRRYRARQNRVEKVETFPTWLRPMEPEDYKQIEAGTVAKNRRLGARDRILDALRAEPDGLTCAELETRLGLSHKNASARLAEMQWAGVIVESGKRSTGRGGKGAVYKVNAIQEVA
jgi:hypothetical protein